MTPPDEIKDLLSRLFVERAAYGQFSTVDKDGHPSTRTVHLHLSLDQNQIRVVTNTQSEKYLHVQQNPKVSGCYWSKEDRIQIRFQADASLITSAHTDQLALLDEMWAGTREEVRTAYLLDDNSIPLYREHVDVDVEKRSAHFGMIACSVTRWDVFFESKDAYRFGKRHIFDLADASQPTWTKKERSSLHEKKVILYDQQSSKGTS